MTSNLKHNAKFKDVLADEKKVIGKSKGLVGLAFSGGGIRSATTNLGILQSLAEKNLLGQFDYLSTVSGGGYIGAFLTSLLARSKGKMELVKDKLSTENHSAEVGFLRKYSHYLTPQTGLSTDTMAAFSVWLTNTILIQAVLILAIATCCSFGFAFDEFTSRLHSNVHWSAPILGLTICLVTMIVAIKESVHQYKGKVNLQNDNGAKTNWKIILTAGLIGAFLISIWLTATDYFTLLAFEPKQGVTLSPFWLVYLAFVGIACAMIILAIGLTGRGYSILNFTISSYEREWWARLGGVTIYLCFAWFSGFLLVLYLPLSLDVWISNHTYTSVGSWGVVATISAYLGKSASTRGLNSFKVKEKITTVLPWLVIAGLITLVSFGVFKLKTALISLNIGELNQWLEMETFFALTVVFGLLTCFLAWRVDVNIFSLYLFYRNRLTRAYLGATNTKRAASAFTGFDPNDDISLSHCKHRPLHIVNTAVNLTSTKDLAWQQRMAAAFTFTPLYTGFEFPDNSGAYQPTAEYGGKGGAELGGAMAISGAAASPNSGYHTSPAAAFIMTMFNARLGRWCGNPLKDKWQTSGPAFGLSYLIKELLAQTNIKSNYVYLSDGGHFENLGIYELVRRECQLVVAVDCGQDGDFTFEDLGNAIRKCKTDFGANIEIDVTALHPTVQSKFGNFKHAEKHYAIGEIYYKSGEVGILLFIKNSLTGDEPADLINYKLHEPTFPHHSTVDQSFNESQFESYRELGYHMGNTIIAEIAASKETTLKNLLGLNTSP